MGECECLTGCAFFNDNLNDMPSTTHLMKQRYCKKDNRNCARYTVFKALGKEKVPPDLFPNMLKRANGMLLSA